MAFKSFWFCLTLSVPEKLKNSIFEMPIITKSLNINNLRTTSAKSINLPTIRKLVEYSFKIVRAKATFTLTVFETLLPKGRSVLWTAQQGTGSEKVNYAWNISVIKSSMKAASTTTLPQLILATVIDCNRFCNNVLSSYYVIVSWNSFGWLPLAL